MAFETRTTEDLIKIASAGGGFVIDAGARQTEELVLIASAGSIHGARLVFRGLILRSTDDIVRIAAASKGCVQFIS